MFVCENSDEFAPPTDSAMPVSEAVPVLLSVTVRVVVVPILVVPKEMEDALSPAFGAVGTATPVPDSGTVWVGAEALSEMVTAAVLAPAAVGLKTTEILQAVFTGMEAEQLLVWVKSVGLAPAMAMLVILSAAVPLLESTTVCAELAEATF